MLPTVNAALINDIEFAEPPSYTFRLDTDNNTVAGFTDGLDAMKQAIYLILETERFIWAIFSWNYGTELEDLYGKPVSWVIPEAERRISEALIQDTRITSVENFEFNAANHKLAVSFTVRTIFGDIPAKKEVEY